MGWFGYIVWVVLWAVYAGITWQSLLEASAPALACHPPSTTSSSNHKHCFRPAKIVGDRLILQLQLLLEHDDYNETQLYSRSRRWVPVETCRMDLVVPKAWTSTAPDEPCTVRMPVEARHRSKVESEVRPLKARFVVLEEIATATATTTTASGSIDTVGNNRTTVLGTIRPFFLTRVEKREPRSVTRLLLDPGARTATTATNSNQSAGSGHDSTLNGTDSESSHGGGEDSASSSTTTDDATMWVPYLKFGRAPIRIRFVAEDRGYAVLRRADGISLAAVNASAYAPMVYVDELSLQRSAQIELAPASADKPPVTLHIKLGSMTPMVDTLYRQVRSTFEYIETNGFFVGPELDELKYFLRDEHLYRFALTNIISTLHVWIDYLAFRDEVRFYRGRENLSGVSASTVVGNTICSLIILLYLIDGGVTSWVVLVGLVSSLVVEVWKMWKLLRPSFTTAFPFVALRRTMSPEESKTTEYDRIACRKLSWILYPLVVGWSLYALVTYEYRSVYSWLISNLANGVYTFGFISMCPQLYVNYRLKSVAHLPWKVFLYKLFNTFVDDAFAWLIEMPLKHRLMTLRDDVVFLVFLLQVYWYRVDKTRRNEFGYSYEDKPQEDDDQDGGGDGGDGSERDGAQQQQQQQQQQPDDDIGSDGANPAGDPTEKLKTE